MSKKTAAQPAEPERKPLGLVWVDCDDQPLCLEVEKVLEAEANVYCGLEAPAEENLSCIICPYGEDITSELRRLRKTLVPDIPLLVFGPRADLPLTRIALREGAHGFIHAGMTPEQIGNALRIAVEGSVVVPRELLKELVAEEHRADLSTLDQRQLEIIELVAEGLTNHQIARRLFLAESTVKQHLSAAYKALGVRNRLEAKRLVRENG